MLVRSNCVLSVMAMTGSKRVSRALKDEDEEEKEEEEEEGTHSS